MDDSIYKEDGKFITVPKTYSDWLDDQKRQQDILENIPDEDKAEYMYLNVVRCDPLALKEVPEKSITLWICLDAVEKNGLALEHVPEKFKTLWVCYVAVLQNGRAGEYVPDRLQYSLNMMLMYSKQEYDRGEMSTEDMPASPDNYSREQIRKYHQSLEKRLKN